MTRYTWIVGGGIDPGATLSRHELGVWRGAAEAYLATHEPDHIMIDVRGPLPGDAEGLFRGTYPDLRGLVTSGSDDDSDAEARMLTDRAFEDAWAVVVNRGAS